MSYNVAISTSYQPSSTSLAFRAQIAQAISPLRRVTPRVPFWKLGAHRLPVLWSLYRGLLRAAPTPDVRWRVKQQFRKNQRLTSPNATERHLQFAHKLLDMLQSAKQGESHAKAIIDRYAFMMSAKRDKDTFKTMLVRADEERKKLLGRPILKGYFRPTPYNGPLPRLYPQPAHIAGMINSRRKASERRYARFLANGELMRDLNAESTFESQLADELTKDESFGPTFSRAAEWVYHHKVHSKAMFRSFLAESDRARKPFPPELVEQIEAARKDRVRNKRHEFEREMRGEVVRKTVQRRNKAPPAHVLQRMSPLRKHLDEVARGSVSEVGYVGWAKAQMGYKLRNPDAWKVEIGKDEDQPRLEALEEEIRKENERRRKESEEVGQKV